MGSDSKIKNAYLIPTIMIETSTNNFYSLFANNDTAITTCVFYINNTQFAHNNTAYYKGSTGGSWKGVYIYKIRLVRF